MMILVKYLIIREDGVLCQKRDVGESGEKV